MTAHLHREKLKKQILRNEFDDLKAYAVKIYSEEQQRSNFTSEDPSSGEEDGEEEHKNTRHLR